MKKILITGASGGIGRCLAVGFARQGNTVYVVARGKERLAELSEQFPENVFAYPADVSDAKQVKKTFAEIQRVSAGIDVLINSAGVGNLYLLGHVDFEVIDKTIDTNLKGAMYCTYSVLPGMIEKQYGYIINIASVSGISGEHWAPPPGKIMLCDYAVSKCGLVGFANHIGKSLRHHNILMTTLCPGRIATELWEKVQKKLSAPESELVQPEEIFDLINFIITRQPRTLYKQVVFFSKDDWH